MRIKLDENLPTGLVQLLTSLGHDVDTMADKGVAGQDDTVVWRAAQGAGRFLITQDLDFSDARTYAPGTHHGILLVRLPQPGRTALSERVETLFRGEEVESWAGCMVTATLRKVRVKRATRALVVSGASGRRDAASPCGRRVSGRDHRSAAAALSRPDDSPTSGGADSLANPGLSRRSR